MKKLKNWNGNERANVPTKNQAHGCKAKTKTGKRCQAAATEGGLCFFHANPLKAAELGRIGGRSHRRPAVENADPLPKVETATAVREAVAQLIADVYTGKLQPKVTAALTPLLSLQLRAIESTDLEQRIGKMEKLLAKFTNEGTGGVPA